MESKSLSDVILNAIGKNLSDRVIALYLDMYRLELLDLPQNSFDSLTVAQTKKIDEAILELHKEQIEGIICLMISSVKTVRKCLEVNLDRERELNG